MNTAFFRVYSEYSMIRLYDIIANLKDHDIRKLRILSDTRAWAPRVSTIDLLKITLMQVYLGRWCLHLIVVVGFERSRDPESYAGGSVATGRSTHAGQVTG
jgi:hypothetical protein